MTRLLDLVERRSSVVGLESIFITLALAAEHEAPLALVERTADLWNTFAPTDRAERPDHQMPLMVLDVYSGMVACVATVTSSTVEAILDDIKKRRRRMLSDRIAQEMARRMTEDLVNLLGTEGLDPSKNSGQPNPLGSISVGGRGNSLGDPFQIGLFGVGHERPSADASHRLGDPQAPDPTRYGIDLGSIGRSELGRRVGGPDVGLASLSRLGSGSPFASGSRAASEDSCQKGMKFLGGSLGGFLGFHVGFRLGAAAGVLTTVPSAGSANPLSTGLAGAAIGTAGGIQLGSMGGDWVGSMVCPVKSETKEPVTKGVATVEIASDQEFDNNSDTEVVVIVTHSDGHKSTAKAKPGERYIELDEKKEKPKEPEKEKPEDKKPVPKDGKVPVDGGDPQGPVNPRVVPVDGGDPKGPVNPRIVPVDGGDPTGPVNPRIVPVDGGDPTGPVDPRVFTARKVDAQNSEAQFRGLTAEEAVAIGAVRNVVLAPSHESVVAIARLDTGSFVVKFV
ncbi:MAG: hypothetical protein U0Q11_11700 [Vicinamibacterales bacterium]